MYKLPNDPLNSTALASEGHFESKLGHRSHKIHPLQRVLSMRMQSSSGEFSGEVSIPVNSLISPIATLIASDSSATTTTVHPR